jgi:hypothetical protein
VGSSLPPDRCTAANSRARAPVAELHGRNYIGDILEQLEGQNQAVWYFLAANP